MKKRILTGLRPTGKLHIGHYLGMLKNSVRLQHEYEQFLLIANVQALTDNADNPLKVKDSIIELLLDFYAVGIDFDVTNVYIQSEVSELHELFIYLANFASIQQLSHHPTLKTELSQKGLEESTPLGFYIYPIHQAADILCVNADLVPVGKDQAPMIEDTRILARKFNNTYGRSVLKEPEALFGVEKNVPGIDGNEKMGKSLGNAIYLSDEPETLRKKVNAIVTDPNRIHATDPGNVEGNVVFLYHDAFNPDIDEVNDLKERYRKGTVGDVEVKDKLYIAMNALLEPIREKRREAELIKDDLLNKALDGSEKVSRITREIVDEMKDAMKIKYARTSKPAAISIDEFKRLDIRIGKVVLVEKVPEADKLLKIIVDLGNETRQIMAGMAAFFEDPQVLVGKELPILANLEYKEFKGNESQGMIIAADENGHPVLLHPEKPVQPGTLVK